MGSSGSKWIKDAFRRKGFFSRYLNTTCKFRPASGAAVMDLPPLGLAGGAVRSGSGFRIASRKKSCLTGSLGRCIDCQGDGAHGNLHGQSPRRQNEASEQLERNEIRCPVQHLGGPRNSTFRHELAVWHVYGAGGDAFGPRHNYHHNVGGGGGGGGGGVGGVSPLRYSTRAGPRASR